jgi:hypothetical protein
MADVQIQQTPNGGGSSTWLWAIVVLVLIALVAWFILAGRGRSSRTDVNIQAPGAGAPAGGGGTGGGGTGGGGTKTP